MIQFQLRTGNDDHDGDQPIDIAVDEEISSSSLSKDDMKFAASSNSSSSSSISVSTSSHPNYTRPTFSASFLAHLEEVKRQRLGRIANEHAEEGVSCVGEPSIDPSRMIASDGIDSEFLNDYNH